MRIFSVVLIFFIIVSCGQNVNSDSKLMLNSNITRLGKVSKKAVGNWEAYKDLENNLKVICSTNPLNAISFRKPLLNNIESMGAHIPQSLNTSSVQKSLKIVNNRIVSFYQDVGEDELDKKVVERHLDSIMIAFGNLNQSLNQSQIN